MVDIPPKTRYASHYELSQLPYFDVRDGRLVTTDDFGPIVDVHTHLALSYGLRGRVDLMREHDRTENRKRLGSDPVLGKRTSCRPEQHHQEQPDTGRSPRPRKILSSHLPSPPARRA